MSLLSQDLKFKLFKMLWQEVSCFKYMQCELTQFICSKLSITDVNSNPPTGLGTDVSGAVQLLGGGVHRGSEVEAPLPSLYTTNM